MTLYTRPQRTQPPPTRGVSPTLVFQKWHAYDGPSLETKESRSKYLEKVARAVKDVAGSSTYRNWYASYDGALTVLGVQRVRAWTVGRLVAGVATNPALETGLQLHHLLGVPCLPGSAIKGLVHHVAEMELSEVPGLADDSILEDSGELDELLQRAEAIWRIFGSLTVEPAREVRQGEQQRLGPETVRSKLLAWRRQERIPKSLRERVDGLLDQHTGGRLACYDAMPVPGATELLELDVLNPHYPLYYRTEGEEVPSDDQDPVPVFFLVVRPGVRFVFPWRLRRTSEEQVSSAEEESDEELVEKWFAESLRGWGAGGKTAAGYGYFELEDVKESGVGIRYAAEES